MRYYKRRNAEDKFVEDSVNAAIGEVLDISVYVSLSTLGENSSIFDLQVEYANNDKVKEGNSILSKAGFTTDLKSIK